MSAPIIQHTKTRHKKLVCLCLHEYIWPYCILKLNVSTEYGIWYRDNIGVASILITNIQFQSFVM